MYCIDASALIDGWVRYYPPDVLPTLWKNMEILIRNGRLLAPEEVRLELERGGDDLYEWASQRNGLFRPATDQVQTRLTEIVNRFPDFVPDHSNDGVWADAYVIALAQVEHATVVTGEKLAPGNARHPKIPNICTDLVIDYINILGLIRAESWLF